MNTVIMSLGWWICVMVILPSIVCPPVETKAKETKKDRSKHLEDVEFGLEYERYLKEVVTALESDDVFKQKLQEANVTDIKSGEIARHLDLIGHNVRSHLDELKRNEIERLRRLIKEKVKIKKDIAPDARFLQSLVGHIDHKNEAFGVNDLSNLIKKASEDLEQIDQQRQNDFKRYEMEKEVVRREKLKELNDEQRKAEIHRQEEMKKKHKEHPQMHHPGSKDQLKEVWEESDHLDADTFDPRTFFMLHDTDGNGYLDEPEIEALFQIELNKVYDPDLPEDDMMERYEEMNRMREHLMTEVDTDKDKLISYEEFMENTKQDGFNEDEGWDGLDDEAMFSEEELEKFEREYEEAMRQHAQPGEINIPPVQGSSLPPPIMHRPSNQRLPPDTVQRMNQERPPVPHPARQQNNLKFNPNADPQNQEGQQQINQQHQEVQQQHLNAQQEHERQQRQPNDPNSIHQQPPVQP